MELSKRVSIATPELRSFGDSEMSYTNGRGFNFDVAPSLVGIWCPLISDVGDVGVAWGKSKGKRFDTEVQIKSRRFGVRSELRNKVKGFGVRIGESEWYSHPLANDTPPLNDTLI